MKTFLVLAATLLALVDGAADIEKYKYNVRGNSVWASGSGYDGCLYRYFGISASDSVTKNEPGKPVASKFIWIYFEHYDWCNGVYRSGWVGIPDAPLTINVKKGTTLSFEDTVTVCDWYTCDDTVPVKVDAQWTPTGSSYASRYTNHYSTPFYSSHSRGSGISYEAIVTLDVVMDGDPFDFDYIYGELYKNHDGSMEVYKSN